MDDTKIMGAQKIIPRKQWSLQEKQRHYDDWKKTGFSYQEYGRRHQLSPKTFGTWVRQFKKAPDKKMSFFSVPLKKPEVQENPSLEIKLPNGILCRFTQTWDKEHIISIVRSLNAISH